VIQAQTINKNVLRHNCTFTYWCEILGKFPQHSR